VEAAARIAPFAFGSVVKVHVIPSVEYAAVVAPLDAATYLLPFHAAEYQVTAAGIVAITQVTPSVEYAADVPDCPLAIKLVPLETTYFH
jgi:hypothetical protein